MVCLDIYISLVVQLRLSVFQHWVFLIGNPTSSIMNLLEESCTLLPLSGIWPKLHLTSIVQILLRVELFCRLQQWRPSLGHFSTYFQWRRVPFHWDDSKEGPCAYFYILAPGQPFINPYSIVYVWICVISVGGVAGWFCHTIWRGGLLVKGIFLSSRRSIGAGCIISYIRSATLSRSVFCSGPSALGLRSPSCTWCFVEKP